MHISVTCFATLSKYSPPGGTYPLQDGLTLGGLVTALGVPVQSVKVAFVNGRHAEFSQALAPGDRVGIFPAVAGG